MNSRNYRERLIDEVKKYPVLYDTQHENHRDIDVRDRCWLEISERLGANSEVLKREWKILRDSMRQALKRSKTGATTKSGLPCKKWRFQSRMAFVLPYMTIRRNPRFDKSRVKPDEAEASEQEGEAEAWEPPAPEHDSLELFFASVCQSAKRLPRKHQAALKRHVLDALLRAEADWEADQADSKAELNKDFD
ncbi:transcription factor Adf-1-like [Helicoverpa zea]|uniref:transcription factor Adf-1-like n=1 Tax=Helicoverpa zea TaxID=7113 RepID=UPI001F59FF61|nr:transcription factor Adf-1 isoform X1 [Helicoverpa armigera]XP_047032265.1 transcription factor Adf-1-like [Helicoverpa zea]XP_049704823.1 transcription factor Adf-1 isoform X2 [Helicoverpa armigera]